MFRRGAQSTQIINAVEMSTGNMLSVDNEGSMIACRKMIRTIMPSN
jgi:hypothetical protein